MEKIYTKTYATSERDQSGIVITTLVMESETGSDDRAHEIPLQAVADRMELYGLESVEQSLELIGRQTRNSEAANEALAGVYDAYAEVVRSEFAQSLMPHPVADPGVQQTMMSPLGISPGSRQKLSERRAEALQILGMTSMVHSAPGARMMDATRPVERTVPAAAEALECADSVVEALVSHVHEHVEELSIWQVDTLTTHVPQLREQLRTLERNGS